MNKKVAEIPSITDRSVGLAKTFGIPATGPVLEGIREAERLEVEKCTECEKGDVCPDSKKPQGLYYFQVKIKAFA